MTQFGNIHFGGTVDMSSRQSTTGVSDSESKKKGKNKKKHHVEDDSWRDRRPLRPVPRPSKVGNPTRFSDLSKPVNVLIVTVYEECYYGYDSGAYEDPVTVDIRPVLDAMSLEHLPALQPDGSLLGTYDTCKHLLNGIDTDEWRKSRSLINAIAMYASNLDAVIDYAYSGGHFNYDVIVSGKEHDDYAGYREWRQSIAGTVLEDQIMKDGNNKVHATRLNAVKWHVIRASRDSEQEVAKLAEQVLASHTDDVAKSTFNILADIGTDTGCPYMDDRRYLELQKSGDSRFENPDCPVLIYDDVDNGGPMDWNGKMTFDWVNVRPLLDTLPLDKLPVPFAMDEMLNGNFTPISDEEDDPDYDDSRDVFWDYCRGSEIDDIDDYIDYAESNDYERDDMWGYSSYPDTGFGISLRGDKDEDRDEFNRDLDYFDYLRWRRSINPDVGTRIAERGKRIISQLHMAAMARRIEDKCLRWCNSDEEFREALSAIVNDSMTRNTKKNREKGEKK